MKKKELSHSAEYSQVEAKYIVMPQHSNPNGLMFGGVLMSWIDMAAAMVAEKHSALDVATVHVDEINFDSPILIGDHVTIRARLISTGKCSMKISVDVGTENTKKRLSKKTTSAVLTFVAVDKNKKAKQVPKLK